MRQRLISTVGAVTLCAILAPGLTQAASPQVKAELSCDGAATTGSGDASDIRGWANRTFAQYRRTCSSGSLMIWSDWMSDEPDLVRSF